MSLIDDVSGALLLNIGDILGTGFRDARGEDVLARPQEERLETFCRAGVFGGGFFSGIRVLADDADRVVASGDAATVELEDVRYVVGVPWAFTGDPDERNDRRLWYLWREQLPE